MNIGAVLLLTCLGSWALVSWALFPSAGAEIFLGMLAPLILVWGTSRLVEKTWAESPGQLTSVMATAFLLKMIFCGVYVALVVGVFAFEAEPFAASFAVYFAGLYLAEAFHLRTVLQTR